MQRLKCSDLKQVVGQFAGKTGRARRAGGIVLAVPDEPDRGRKPVLHDQLAAFLAKRQYPYERISKD
ncbi:MAG: hypothetical protein JXA30_10080 [Deltaproteobacteria bacterium]|nr:hypothetical protein [Deltaproteobacteria bacterium]